jgi:hypothetical protein
VQQTCDEFEANTTPAPVRPSPARRFPPDTAPPNKSTSWSKKLRRRPVLVLKRVFGAFGGRMILPHRSTIERVPTSIYRENVSRQVC